jgi:hypothetical protein
LLQGCPLQSPGRGSAAHPRAAHVWFLGHSPSAERLMTDGPAVSGLIAQCRVLKTTHAYGARKLIETGEFEDYAPRRQHDLRMIVQ